jgi:hypothetical protein
MKPFGERAPSPREAGLRSVEYYRELKRRHLIRLFASYVAPLVLLATFFYFQYDHLERRGRLDHMKAVRRPPHARSLLEGGCLISPPLADGSIRRRPPPSRLPAMLFLGLRATRRTPKRELWLELFDGDDIHRLVQPLAHSL